MIYFFKSDFDWSEADPLMMLSLEPVTNETYLGDSVTVFCQVSRYYFAYGHRFALEYDNGTLHHQMGKCCKNEISRIT